MEIFFFWFMFAVAVGFYAASKGRHGFGWFLLAMIISPLLGFIFCAIASDLKNTKSPGPSEATHVRCPACAELVLPEAQKCKHCGSSLVPDPTYRQKQAQSKLAEETEGLKNLAIGVGALVFLIFIAAVFSKH